MELTNPPGRFVIRNHVSTRTHQECCRRSMRTFTCTVEFLHIQNDVETDIQSISPYILICTPIWWTESCQGCLINSGGRLKPLTQCTAMSCLWFPHKHQTDLYLTSTYNNESTTFLPYVHANTPTHGVVSNRRAKK